MITMKLLLQLWILKMCLTAITADEIRWDKFHQNDYDVIPHHIEVISYNRAYFDVERCEFVKFNRTSLRTLNVSATLLKVLDKPIFGRVQLFKFLSNTYRYFPGSLSGNVCREYERASKILGGYDFSSYTNVTGCPPAPGYYYVKHFSIDYHKLPPYIPRGDYKLLIELHHDKEKLGEVHIFTSIVDKQKKIGG